jgi:hypothetical protein
MTERSSPGTATAMVDKIANIVSDYYDEDADGRWLKCAQHIADSLTDEAATPLEPTEAMLDAARDWSIKKYGRGIGNDAAIGCWKAMLLACPSGVAQAKSEPGK